MNERLIPTPSSRLLDEIIARDCDATLPPKVFTQLALDLGVRIYAGDDGRLSFAIRGPSGCLTVRPEVTP